MVEIKEYISLVVPGGMSIVRKNDLPDNMGDYVENSELTKSFDTFEEVSSYKDEITKAPFYESEEYINKLKDLIEKFSLFIKNGNFERIYTVKEFKEHGFIYEPEKGDMFLNKDTIKNLIGKD